MDLQELEKSLTGEEVTSQEIIAALVLLVVGVALAWVIRRWSRRIITGLDPETEQLARLGVRVVQVLTVAVFIGWGLTILGADIGWLTLMVLVAGFILVLAIRPILEGLGAAAALSTRPAFSVGDEIAVDDVLGEVTQITSRSTVIGLRDGRVVHIPNVEMLRKTVTVYTAKKERRSSVDIPVGFDTDLDLARKDLKKALAEIDGITRVGSIRTRPLPDGIELSIRFWHSSNIEAGNDMKDAALAAILATLDEDSVTIGTATDIVITDQRRHKSS